MSILWHRGSATVGEIRMALQDDLAYPTVQTMLRVLETKRFVRHTQDGRAFRFVPVVDRDAAADSALRRLVNKVYRGSRALLMTRLIADEAIPAHELRHIKHLLEQRLDRVKD